MLSQFSLYPFELFVKLFKSEERKIGKPRIEEQIFTRTSIFIYLYKYFSISRQILCLKYYMVYFVNTL